VGSTLLVVPRMEMVGDPQPFETSRLSAHILAHLLIWREFLAGQKVAQ
jgi:hypothetical protein